MVPLKSHKCFEGLTQFWEHDSESTGTKMKFASFVPKGEVHGCVIWLSGLTCTEENFLSKAGAQRALAREGLMALCPDTSPRGLSLPGEHESWDFGSGASFYVDATTEGYRDHYRMDRYVSQEIHAMARDEFGAGDRISIMGHSMGGHGALVLGLREPTKYRSISAFAPIVNPSAGPWGEKAFAGYLGPRGPAWEAYDACRLVMAGARHPHEIRIDQGDQDPFLEKELLTSRFIAACERAGQPLGARMRPGYDHGYYFVSTFIDEHVAFHASALRKS